MMLIFVVCSKGHSIRPEEEAGQATIKALTEPVEPGEVLRITWWCPEMKPWVKRNWDRIIPQARRHLTKLMNEDPTEGNW